MPPQDKTIEIDSISVFQYLLEHSPHQIVSVHCDPKKSNPRLKPLLSKAYEKKLSVDLSPLKEGFKLKVLLPRPFDFDVERMRPFPQKKNIWLALDHLQDPQNFGAICRTAEAFSARGILFSKNRSVTLGPGVYQASVGTVATLPLVQVSNLTDALIKLKEVGYWVFGTDVDQKATAVQELKKFENIVLVMGSEAEGLSDGLRKHCDGFVSISYPGKVESLNVSVATAILLYELS